MKKKKGEEKKRARSGGRVRHIGDVMVLGWCGMRFRGELDMERLEVPDKFGDIWTITRDGKSVNRARYSAGRLRMSCMGARRGLLSRGTVQS